MIQKNKVIGQLQDIYQTYEKTLALFNETQLTQPLALDHLTVKDTLIHLWAWQQIAIARVEAALQNSEPKYPTWPTEDPDSEKDIDLINAWIYQQNQHKTWSQVYAAWRRNFQHLLEIANQISDQDLNDTKKYAWLNGYSLADVLAGTAEHHAEHLEQLKQLTLA